MSLLLVPVLLSLQNDTASLQGSIVDRATSEGIVGASVLLTGIVDNHVVHFITKTTGGGEFLFPKVPPSTAYWLMASHGEEYVPGFYQQRGLSETGMPISVSAGDRVRDLRIAMVPTGEISGRVLDAGRPVSDAQVGAMIRTHVQPPFGNGAVHSEPVKAVRTNSRGEYRITGLPPGPVYLQALIRNVGGNWDLLPYSIGAKTQPPQTESSGYPLFYFPGTTNTHAAEPLYLKAAERKSKVDIVVSKVGTRRVRGSIVEARTGTTIRFAQLCLVDRYGVSGWLPYRTVEISDGRFDLRGVLPGSYDLVVTAIGRQPRLTGHIILDVGTENREGLIIPLSLDLDLSGRVSGQGSGLEKGDLSGVEVTLKPQPPAAVGPFRIPAAWAETLSVPAVTAASASGLLALRGIQPWRYFVDVSHKFKDTYVKSIRLGRTDVIAEGLTVEGPFPADLEVVLASPSGAIEGQVFDVTEKPAGAFRVVLLPDQRQRRDLYRQVWTDNDGRFQLTNLPPGGYELFAWEFVDNEMWLDSDFLRLYEGRGNRVQLEEGSRRILRLQTIPPWF